MFLLRFILEWSALLIWFIVSALPCGCEETERKRRNMNDANDNARARKCLFRSDKPLTESKTVRCARIVCRRVSHDAQVPICLCVLSTFIRFRFMLGLLHSSERHPSAKARFQRVFQAFQAYLFLLSLPCFKRCRMPPPSLTSPCEVHTNTTRPGRASSCALVNFISPYVIAIMHCIEANWHREFRARTLFSTRFSFLPSFVCSLRSLK